MNVLKIVKEYSHSKPKTKKLIGSVIIVLGIIAMILPVVPGAWIVIIGLEIFGVKLIFLDRIKAWMKKNSSGTFSAVFKRCHNITKYLHISKNSRRTLFILGAAAIFALVSPLAVGYFK